MSEKYVPGERIRITIDATVQSHQDDEIEYQYPTALGACEGVVVLDCSPVTVERVAPVEWPPRPGDLWRDRDGDLWLTRPADANGIFLLAGKPSKAPPFGSSNHIRLMRQYGPLTLVHREDEEPTR